jgi:hypothetical protein
MANFCSNCRFPLAASASFCPQCGRALAAVQPAAPSPAPAAPGGSSTMKIFVIVIAFFVVGGMAAIGVGYYAVHKVKQAVVAKAESYGVDVNSIPSPIPSSSSSRHKVYKPCELFPKSEASRFLGEPIERTAIMDAACLYYGPPGLAEKLGAQGVSEMMSKAKAGVQMNGGDVADTVTKMMSAAAAKSGENGAPGGEAPLLTLLVDPDGRPQMTAVAMSKGIFGGIGAGAGGGAASAGLGADIPNLGDRAIRLGPLGLNVLKGDTVIRIIVGPVPGANEKSIAIARVLLPRV